MKIVSVRNQFPVRIVRSTRSALPTLLKSGCVLVASGTLAVSGISCAPLELLPLHFSDSNFHRNVVIVHIQNCNLTVLVGAATLEHELQFTP
jgi:hypothetical protein